jgi:hypothetical protein
VSLNLLVTMKDILANGLVQTTNRRCQEWTTGYVKRLVSAGYIIGEDAINIVQAQRDPPSHGIGLQAIARG